MNEICYRSVSVCVEKTGFFKNVVLYVCVLFARMYIGICMCILNDVCICILWI